MLNAATATIRLSSKAHHIFFHAYGLEQLAFTVTPVLPLLPSGSFADLMSRLSAAHQPQTPAGNIACRITHQTRGILNIHQHFIAIDFTVGGESANHIEQALTWNTPHRRELASRWHHHADLITAIDANCEASCSPRMTIYFPGSGQFVSH